jgi:hypothetical protein
MANELDECVTRVMAASMAENEAIDSDRKNQRAEAIAKYEESVREYTAAIAAALPNHSEDRPKLIEHKKQVESRIATLKSSPTSAIPVEDQIKSVQLAMAGASTANAAVQSAGGMKTMAACAGLGAVGGAIILGGGLGLTAIGAVGGAAGAAYVATRQDAVGDAARSAGNTALQGVAKAQEVNQKHQITTKIADAGSAAAAKAKAINEQHQITSRISSATAGAVSKAKEIEAKHQVTDKVASGFAKGLDKVSSLMGGRGSQSSASGSTGGYSGGAPPAGK